MAIVVQTKTEIIYDDLKTKIQSGILKPKSKLVICTLAKEYGSSEIPVREALKELVADGLVETIPHVGYKVINISAQNIKDMLQLREYLEPFAAELAAENSTPSVVCHLQNIYDQIEKAAKEKNIEKYSALNRLFHRVIIQSCGNMYLQKTLEELYDIDKRTREVFKFYPEIIEESRLEHKKMIHYMEQKKGRELAQLIDLHKKRAFEKMRRHFKIE